MRNDMLSPDAVLGLLRREADAAGSQGKLAEQLGVSPQYLSEVMRGKKEPGPAILAPLMLSREVRYRKLTK